MNKTLRPTTFEFVSTSFIPKKKVARFLYRQHFKNAPSLSFEEKIVLPRIPSVELSATVTKSILRDLHLSLGLSYYKMFFAPRLKHAYVLTGSQKMFWDTLYRDGLGEYLFKNSLHPDRAPRFSARMSARGVTEYVSLKDRSLVGVSGGKDSIVAAKLLQEYGQPLSAFFVATERMSPIVERVIQKLGVPHLGLLRKLDPKVFSQDIAQYNGHIPVSVITAFLGVFSALLYDYRYVVVANEYSSDFGNIEYRGLTVNHQWSKSQEVEALFQQYVRENITPSVEYYSQTRPFYELRVVELFTKYSEYFPLFSSCNRSYTSFEKRSSARWCGECAKCAFAYVMMAAFLPKVRLKKIFGQDLFAKPELLSVFQDLLGFGTMKPFDCVGTFEETQVALYMAAQKFSAYRNDLVVKKFLPRIRPSADRIQEIFSAHHSPLLPARFRFLGMKNALILGYGKEGKVSEQYLQKYYPQLRIGIADKKQGKDYLLRQKEYDIVVKTPGISLVHITRPHTTATQIFFSHVKDSIIGVTGTKGKSTTSALIYALLKERGLPVRLAGNIGTPMLSEVLRPRRNPKTVYVTELSSYQLEDLHMSPRVAVVTNLFPEHMDYHGTLQAYYGAKKHIVEYQSAADIAVFHKNLSLLASWIKDLRGTLVFTEKKLPVALSETKMLGAHNEDNIRLAVTVARMFGVTQSEMVRALKKFRPLPHRIEFVGTFQGVSFFDDAISTTPESTLAALRSLKKVSTIFLGGTDRGYDFSELERYLVSAKIHNIVLFPETGKRIFKRTPKGFRILRTSSMKAAVRFAYLYTPKGDICLLSTASPSYSLWKNFEAKGMAFQRAVRAFRPKK